MNMLPSLRRSVLACATMLFPFTLQAEDYRLGSGDILALRVQEWPDLSGTFTVGPEGRVVLPVIGSVPAQDLTLEELTLSVRDELGERLGNSDSLGLMLEIRTFRPFYILGTEKAGEYPFRPGMTVLQAVSLAGGPARTLSAADARPERDAIRAQGEMMAARAQLDMLHIREARLRAELDDRDTFELPDHLIARQDQAELEGALQLENQLLTQRRAALTEALAHVERMIALHDDELAAIDQSIEARDEQIALIQDEYDSMRSLEERGLTTTQRVSAIRQELATIITLRRDLDTRVVQIRQNVEKSTQELSEIRDTYRETALKDIQEVRSLIATAAAGHATASRLLSEAQQFGNLMQEDEHRSDGPLVYSIQRRTEEGFVTLAANETTPVSPGDVVMVERSGMMRLGALSGGGD